MDELKELKDLINGNKENNMVALENLSNPKEIVKRLQEIEIKLLCNYSISIGNIKIFPILLEAYYKNSKYFNDKHVHGSPRQYGRFGEVYIHEDGYGGIDLCLSDSREYALSFLIKNSIVRVPKQESDGYYEFFLTQTKLYDFLENEKNCGIKHLKDENGKKYYELKKPAEISKSNESLINEKDVLFLRRKGLTESKDSEHFKCLLAAFSIKNINNYPLTFEGGKERAVAQYIFENNIEPTDENIKEYLGSKSKSVKEYIEQFKQGKEI